MSYLAKDKLFLEAEIKLYSYSRNKIEVDNITSELKYIESKYQHQGYCSFPGESAINYSDVKVSKTNSNAPIETWLLYHDKEYDILLGKKSKLRNQINKIDNALKILNETELEIIKLRYFNPIPWDNVSSKVGYSKGHCKSLRVKAINKIKSLI